MHTHIHMHTCARTRVADAHFAHTHAHAGVAVFAMETTERSQSYCETVFPPAGAALVLGNEEIGVDTEALLEGEKADLLAQHQKDMAAVDEQNVAKFADYQKVCEAKIADAEKQAEQVKAECIREIAEISTKHAEELADKERDQVTIIEKLESEKATALQIANENA